MKKSLVLAACILPLLADTAAGQANIVPDPLPRLPPQPGQGLPIDDVRFLQQASGYSTTQMEVGELAEEKASDQRIKQFASQMAADHKQIKQELTELAQQRDIKVTAAAPAEGSAAAIDRLQGLSGEDFDRTFLDVQLKHGKQLVDLYQAQASASPDTGLASFAITTLVELQQHFDKAQELGDDYGLSVETVDQPPQY